MFKAPNGNDVPEKPQADIISSLLLKIMRSLYHRDILYSIPGASDVILAFYLLTGFFGHVMGGV